MNDRRGYIGSSDIAAIIGLSPFKTAYEVWEEKTAATWEESDNPILRRGRRAEPFILETLKSEFDVWVAYTNTRSEHVDHAFLCAESDFKYVKDSIATGTDELDECNLGHGEIKSIGFNRGEWGEAGSQDVPPYYLAQVMFALACNGLTEATIWACFGFDDIRPYRFEYDAEAGEALVQAAVNFWNNHVLPKVPPATKTVDDCKKVLSRFNGFTWEGSAEAINAASRMQSLKKSMKLLEEELGAAEKQFLDSLADAAKLYGVEPTGTKNFTILSPGGQKLATWNLQHRKSYEVKECDFRVLRFATHKGDE